MNPTRRIGTGATDCQPDQARPRGHVLWKALAWNLLAAVLGCQRTPDKAVGPPMKITVAYTVQPQSTLVHVAVAKGYFAEEGLEVQPQIHTHGKAALQSLLEKKADFATVAETPIMFSALKGARFSVIANIEASTRNNAIVARRDAGILNPCDLKGKRVGYTPGTTSDFFLDSFLTAQGLLRKDIRPVPLKPEEMRQAIWERSVDAVCTWNYPLTQIQRELGAASTVFFDREIYTETFNIAASREVMEGRHEAVHGFLRALIKAEQFVASHPEEAQGIVAAATQIDRELVRGVWDAFNYVVRLDQTLLITLEDETRWAMRNHLTDQTAMPDFREVIHEDSLLAIRSAAVKQAR